MHLTFNDLSFQPMVDSEYLLKDKFIKAANVLKLAYQKYGISHIVFPVDLGKIKVFEHKTFYEWVYNIPHQGDKNKILALIKKPFTDDVLQDQVGDLDAFYFENAEIGIDQTYCHGLATAHITETATLSLHTNAFWEQNIIGFFKENIEIGSAEPVKVFNICGESSFEEDTITAYFESGAEVELIETTIKPNDKTHSFRDDHGIDILTAFAKRLKASNYVISIINSLPFNSQTTRFIRRIYTNGMIEIVLHWEDKGYGMVIQTTGRNFRETKTIAQMLKNDFDR
jgi:hypothetical protein